MLDVYNILVKLARDGRTSAAIAMETAPNRMPQRNELIAAVDRMNGDLYAIPNVAGDPTLKHGLLRIREINRMVREHAAHIEPELEDLTVVATAGGRRGVELRYEPNSGEMRCPECQAGTLCYLVGADDGVFVECSTVDCLYWDTRR